ncbi:sn-glycerol-3-phosphate ABC transporter ATP-binding protein UgpC [bacterium]|nr:sn-glycerol-3-phosphate ABC transporter ATP-binding protein UgpC [bacterium]
MAQVSIQNVVKSFKGPKKQIVQAVNDVSLEIADREFLVLVGPSGCGKTTLLRMIAGLEDIDRGTISIGGRVVNKVEPKDRDIAMVFQNYALYPHMTAYDNMAFGLKLRKVPKSEIQERVRDAAVLLGISELLDRYPKELSGGQRQRVAVGRAIVRDPKVFLFDEPLSNLDAQVRLQVRAEIARLHQRLQATMIYVTHDQAEAMTLGDRIAVMKDGVVQQVDEPMKIYDRPANKFVAGFIGEPQMNFVRGTVVQKDGQMRFLENDGQDQPALGGLALKLEGAIAETLQQNINQPTWLGIRPEHVKPASGEADSIGTANVEFTEHLGAESWVHLKSKHHALTMRCDPADATNLTGGISLAFESEGLRFFDGQSESSLA